MNQPVVRRAEMLEKGSKSQNLVMPEWVWLGSLQSVRVHSWPNLQVFLSITTGTFSKIAAYEFTTLTCIPGVLQYKGAKIQLLDLPGIIEGAKDGKGRGRQVIAVGRTCNLIIIVLDSTRPMQHKRIIEH